VIDKVPRESLKLDEFWYDDANFDLRDDEPKDRKRAALAAKWAKNLRRTRSFDDPVRFTIACKLDDCRPRRRCWLAACPDCSHAFQRWAFDGAHMALTPFGPLGGLTIVPAGLQRFQGTLATLKLASAHRHLRRLLTDAGVENVPMIGVLDLSFNIHSEGLWKPLFQPHFALLLPDQHTESVSSLLRPYVKNHPAGGKNRQPVQTPIRRQAISDVNWQGSDTFKYRPVQKTWFEAYSFRAHPTEQWLQPQQQVEALLWFGEQPPEARLFMVGIRRYGDMLKVL
jgi:hypothetical protein